MSIRIGMIIMEVLSVKNLSKIYGIHGNEVKALNNINLDVKKGEFIAIIGSSGSGKSTLLHIIGGVDNPTSGKVYINGEDLYALNDNKQSSLRRTEIGLIYQFYNLIPTLNVRENIILPSEIDGKFKDDDYLQSLIELLELTNREKHLPNELSGGQQQRVSIARAMINHPAILLCDEPTGNLDSKNSQEIMRLLKEANLKYNQTIIMVTHDISLANYANRLIHIEDGVIISDEELA